MIIGITAEKETGKTTSVEYMKQILTAYSKPFVQINFKDALVEELIRYLPDHLLQICKDLDSSPATYDGNPWTIERLFKEKPPQIRKLMQNWGTDFRRKENPLYWVHQWYRKVAIIEAGIVVFVDDVRFLNEAEAVKSFDSHILLRLEGIGFKHTGLDTHSSETEMQQIVPDLTIQSTYGDLPGLHLQLATVVDSIA